jgi:2-beta-glucuronyltransferase
MKKILYLSSHLYESKKSANMHHLCDTSLSNGYDVTFCTAPNSLPTLIREKNNKFVRFKVFLYAFIPKKIENLTISSYFSLLHRNPKFQSALNKLAKFIFQHGYSSVFRNKFDVIVIDSGTELELFKKLKLLNAQAKFVYRVSDSFDYKKDAEDMMELEEEIIDQFDLISTPSFYITKRLLKLKENINIVTHYHGINKKLFQKYYDNPYLRYDEKCIHFIFVGAGRLDYDFLDMASYLSDNYIFHIIGPLKKSIERKNIIYYGEMEFNETIPYLTHANIGLQTLINVPHVEVFERTLKYTQYSFVKIPIVSPSYIKLTDSHVCNYEHNILSIEQCINKAISFDKNQIDTSWIKDWSEIEHDVVKG